MNNIGWPITPSDFLFIGILLSGMILSLRLSYAIGGYIWVERHSIKIISSGREKRISGFWGEIVVVILCAIVLLIIDAMTPDISFVSLSTDHPIASYVVVGICTVLYIWYARSVLQLCARTEADRGKKHLLRLFFTYIAYAPYAIAIYVFATAGFWMLFAQYLKDSAVIAVQHAQILQQLELLKSLHRPEEIQGAIELVYGDILTTGNHFASTMNPAFVVIAIITFIVFLATHSPIKQVLLLSSRSITRYTGVFSLVLFFVLTIINYYLSYHDLSTQTLKIIVNMRPSLIHGRWEILQRFNEIVVDLERKRSFLGFTEMVLNESGVAVIGMALLQIVLSRNHGQKQT